MPACATRRSWAIAVFDSRYLNRRFRLMRFTLMLSRGEHRHFQAIAQATEESGWTSITIPDSLFFPRATESDYPYADTNNIREYISATPFTEPFVAMTWMAAMMKTLR